MRHYLIVYDRDDSEIVYLRRFDSGTHAIGQRFVIEKAFKPPRYEVVVLGADSLAACRVTHARYFLTAAEIAQRAL